MRFAPLNAASTIVHDLPRRPSAAGTYVVYDRSGGEQQASGAASLDAVNTTLSGAAAAGAQSVTVTSATGVTVGRRYLIGTSEDQGGEWVTCSMLSSTTVGLARRLRRAQASGAGFQSTRLSFAIPAIATAGRNYRVCYAWPVADAQPDVDIPFDVTRYTPTSTLTTEDLRDSDALLAKRIGEGTWLPAVIADAWSLLLKKVAQKLDPGAVVGAVDLTDAHGYLTRYLLAENATGDDAEKHRALMEQRYGQELDAALSTLSTDKEQDGSAIRSGWYRGIQLVRG